MLPADHANPDTAHHLMNELKPHLFFSKQQGDETINYLLESFEQALPRYQLRKRIDDFVDYIDVWDDINSPVPVALFICATTADLLYVKRRAKKQIEESGNGEMVIRATTLGKIQTRGVADNIWEDVA